MNVTQLPAAEAASTLQAWLKPLKLVRDAVHAGAGDRWTVHGAEDAGGVTLRLYAHLEAIGIGFTVAMRSCARLKRLELASALNDELAFARFAVTAEGAVVAEYILPCNDHFLPTDLEAMVQRLIGMQETVRGVLEVGP